MNYSLKEINAAVWGAERWNYLYLIDNQLSLILTATNALQFCYCTSFVSFHHISSMSISLAGISYLIIILRLTSLVWPAVFFWAEDDTDRHLWPHAELHSQPITRQQGSAPAVSYHWKTLKDQTETEHLSRSIGKRGASRGVPWKVCAGLAFDDAGCHRLWDTEEKASPVKSESHCPNLSISSPKCYEWKFVSVAGSLDLGKKLILLMVSSKAST